MAAVKYCGVVLCLVFISNYVRAKECHDITCHHNYGLVNDKKCGIVYTDRIIGGEAAALGSHPWLARIGYYHTTYEAPLEYKCGGSIISEKYILTAAHCVESIPASLKIGSVRLGEHDANSDPDCEDYLCADPVQDYEVESIKSHEDFIARIYKNDVALIRIKGKINFTEWVKPICVPTPDLAVQNMTGQYGKVAGWGISDVATRQVASVLQQVDLQLIDIKKCQDDFSSYRITEEKQICAGGVQDRDSCGGDSGGPMTLVSDVDGMPRTYVYGQVSFGATKCGSVNPAVYTRVSHFLPWVLDHMKE